MDTLDNELFEEIERMCSQFTETLDRGDFDEIRYAMSLLVDKVIINGDYYEIKWTY